MQFPEEQVVLFVADFGGIEVVVARLARGPARQRPHLLRWGRQVMGAAFRATFATKRLRLCLYWGPSFPRTATSRSRSSFFSLCVCPLATIHQDLREIESVVIHCGRSENERRRRSLRSSHDAWSKLQRP